MTYNNEIYGFETFKNILIVNRFKFKGNLKNFNELFFNIIIKNILFSTRSIELILLQLS
jgi:hypothetical protein